MKVFGKILKVLTAILIIAAVVLIFWFGVFTATGNPEIPIPLPVGLLEPPDPSVSAHLYDTVNSSFTGTSQDNALGFPLFQKQAFNVDGTFNKNSSIASMAYLNKFGGTTDSIATWESKSWAPPYDNAEDFYYSKINMAMYLFKIASYNEVMATNFAYLTEAGGSASLAGVSGMLMSQSIRFVNRVFDEGKVGVFREDYFNQQINAMYEANADPIIRSVAEEILKVASRSMNYQGDSYGFSKAFAPTFVEYDNADLAPEEKEFYKPFLSMGNQTVAAGRCTADWEKSVNRSAKGDAKKTDFSKYVGDAELTEKDRANGYKNFNDLFSPKFIVKLDTDRFYNEKTAENDAQKPTVEKVWVDKNGNSTKADGSRYTESDAEAVRFYYDCVMVANVEDSDVDPSAAARSVNGDPVNRDRLKGYTGADAGVKFTQLIYRFSVWDTGLFRTWHTLEGWYGTMVGMITGEVFPNNPTYFAYNLNNTIMEDYIRYVVGDKRAEEEYGITYKDGVTYKNGKVVHDTTKDVNLFDPSKEPLVPKPPLPKA